MRPVLSFDIGSTYTKGALFDLESLRPRLLRRDAAPTTVSDLAKGFHSMRERLIDNSVEGGHGPLDIFEKDNIPIYACSSAKGGLAIAAIGIVPDLTLHAAKLAAASAGGKITAAYAYRLTERQIADMRRTTPDVVLLSGGTDGGNEDYILHNSRLLAEAKLPSVVLYAGNAAIENEIRKILGDAELFIAENLMPEVGKLNIEPARATIQEIFLKKIIEGKGLGAIGSLCAGDIKPTPRSVFDLLSVMSEELPRWNDSALIDLGGATTDFYSCTESFRGEEGFVLKGLREPKLKRTVEGDLGLRVGALSAAETGCDYIETKLAASGLSPSKFRGFIFKAAAEPNYLPQSEEEIRFDEILAKACVYHGLRRHAGSIEETYTSAGKVFVQQGKDLRGIGKWILSGGFLSRRQTADICRDALSAARHNAGKLHLLPQQVDYYADAQYIVPLLGNLAIDFPAEAVCLVEDNLVRM
jgi:uncharacterized protein (TIGR01319 family)